MKSLPARKLNSNKMDDTLLVQKNISYTQKVSVEAYNIYNSYLGGMHHVSGYQYL